MTSSTQVVNLLAREQVRRLLDGDLELRIVSYVENFDGIELEPLFAGEPLAAFLRPDHPSPSGTSCGPPTSTTNRA